MRIAPLALLLLAFAGARAEAADINLFRIRKAILPQNEILLQADVSAACRVQGINFLYLINVNPANGRPQQTRRLRSMAERKFRERFELGPTAPANAAACRAGDASCHSLSVKALEFGWVDHGLADPAVVIRAERRDGACRAAAFVDLGGEARQLDAVRVNADQIRQGLFSASFHVISLELFSAGHEPLTWPCTRNCHKQEGL